MDSSSKKKKEETTKDQKRHQESRKKNEGLKALSWSEEVALLNYAERYFALTENRAPRFYEP